MLLAFCGPIEQDNLAKPNCAIPLAQTNTFHGVKCGLPVNFQPDFHFSSLLGRSPCWSQSGPV